MKYTTPLKLTAIALGAIVLSACATTSQVEAVDAKVNDNLHQTEVNTVAIADLNSKVDRMYQKLMTK